MKRIQLLFIAILGISGALVAQENTQFTHFMFNSQGFNPAYVGSKESSDLTAIYRQQWQGVEGMPTSVIANFNTPFFGKRNGIGIGLMYDEIGITKTTGVNLSYAYIMKFNRGMSLSAGISGSIQQMQVNWTKTNPIDLVDGSIPTFDEQGVAPNFGVGLYFRGRNYHLGLSAPQLLRSGIYSVGAKGVVNGLDVNSFYLNAGFNKKLNSKVEFLPALLISLNPGAPLDVDANITFRFFETFWLGGSYRLDDSVDALAGFQLKNGLRLGFAMDFTTSDLSKFADRTFEVMLGYTFRCVDCDVSTIRNF